MTTLQQIYNEVILVFWENLGFQNGTGTFTDAMFFDAAGDVIQDFLNRTGCIKKIFNLPVTTGTSQYVEPTELSDVQTASVAQSFVFRSSGFYMDNYNPNWSMEIDEPFKWREDEQMPRMVQLSPSPNLDGNQIAVTLPQAGYGVISSTANAVDFDFTVAIGTYGYGTISGAPTGSIYLDTHNPGYGVPGAMVPSTGNLQLIGAVIPYSYSYALNSTIELLPDSAVPFVKYGILEKLFSADGENKDIQRAAYCKMRYADGLALFGAIMGELGVEK